MIPEAKKDVVARALREAFGVTQFEDIRMLTAGLSSALVFRIVVRGCPYLMRVVLDTGATVGPGRGDQTHHFACMKLGAEAGIAPRVWYTSTEDRVAITDFVEARPFPRTEALARLPVTLQALEASRLTQVRRPRLSGTFITAFGRVKSVWPPMRRSCSTPGFI